MNIKPYVIKGFGVLGGYRVSRWLTHEMPKILMYHRFSEKPEYGYVDRAVFERQVHYLQSRFNMMTLENLLEHYYKEGVFPSNSVVITVDDGYKDFYDIAYPVLRKHKIPATFFITTRFVDGDFWLWPDRLRYILQYSREIDFAKVEGGFSFFSSRLTDKERHFVWGIVATYLLEISECNKNIWLSDFAKCQGVEVPERPASIYRASSWDEVEEMSKNRIEVGAHTQSHPSLGRVEERHLAEEINGSIEAIQNKIGYRPTSFCYPNGQPDDYTEIVKRYVKNAGCRGAVTAFYDQYINDDLYALRRFNVGENWRYFIKTVNGVDAIAAKLFRANNIMQACV